MYALVWTGRKKTEKEEVALDDSPKDIIRNQKTTNVRRLEEPTIEVNEGSLTTDGVDRFRKGLRSTYTR